MTGGPTPKGRDVLTSELVIGQALGLFVNLWGMQSEGSRSFTH